MILLIGSQVGGSAVDLPSVSWPLAVLTVVSAIVALGALSQGSRYAVWAAQRLTVRIITAINPEHKPTAWEKQIMRGRGWTASSSSGVSTGSPSGSGKGGGTNTGSGGPSGVGP